jgi:hypothetical protein
MSVIVPLPKPLLLLVSLALGVNKKREGSRRVSGLTVRLILDYRPHDNLLYANLS